MEKQILMAPAHFLLFQAASHIRCPLFPSLRHSPAAAFPPPSVASPSPRVAASLSGGGGSRHQAPASLYLSPSGLSLPHHSVAHRKGGASSTSTTSLGGSPNSSDSSSSSSSALVPRVARIEFARHVTVSLRGHCRGQC